MSTVSTQAIYDRHAAGWVRSKPTLLSDFTARPLVLEALGPLAGMHVLDLGCGEGYLARKVIAAGAATVFGVDVSAEMIANARGAIADETTGKMSFEVADAAAFADYPRPAFDRIMATFLFNYLSRADMQRVMSAARRLMAPGGRFVFSVPHPSFPFLKPQGAPFYFDTRGSSYLEAVDETFEGEIWNLDGRAVPVRCVHKTLEDYFVALRAAGFTRLPDVTELRATPAMIADKPEFFGPLAGLPLHLLFVVDG